MKINTNQNFKALNTVKKGRTGKTEDKVILGQRDNFNFDDIKNLKSMAGCNTRMTPKEYYTKKTSGSYHCRRSSRSSPGLSRRHFGSRFRRFFSRRLSTFGMRPL